MVKRIFSGLLAVGFFAFAASSAFAQPAAATTAARTRIAPGQEKDQPVVASVVALEQAGTLKLSADQRTRLTAISSEAAQLTAERTRLWKEYRAIKARPNFNDDMAANESAPRMHRIVAINARLKEIASAQNAQATALLTADQRAQLNQSVAALRASF